MTVRERIEKLQERMKKQDIQIYIVPTADYHQSEYVDGDTWEIYGY